MDSTLTSERKRQLRRKVPSLMREIQALYKKLDAETGLKGADVPITFGYEDNSLGSYTPADEKGAIEHFHFSLLFIGYLDSRQIHMHDKQDLYRHEYAHYMQYNMEIPKEHTWQQGKHGSAWKYCCSLIGANPTEYFETGKGLEKSDYDKVLKNPWKNPNAGLLDIRRREKEYQNARNSQIQVQEGETVSHPKFGDGVVEAVEAQDGSVRLTIRFADAVRKIDQKWLLRSRYRAPSEGR